MGPNRIKSCAAHKRERFTRVAFFCTQDHQGGESAFEEMQELCKATPIVTVEILHKDVEDNSYIEKIESFLDVSAICKRYFEA